MSNASNSMRFGSSQGGIRFEDQRAVAGMGAYTDDFKAPNQAFVAFLRSPYGHCDITSLNVDAARQGEGVLAVLTGEDLRAAGINDLPCAFPVPDEAYIKVTPRPALAIGRARYAGEPIVAVIAQTQYQAEDALELVDIDFDILPSLSDVDQAMAEDAPVIWPDARGNLAFHYRAGSGDAIEEAFSKAAHITRLRVRNNRVVPSPMEPRSALAEYDADTGRMTLHTVTQGVGAMRGVLAGLIFKTDPRNVRVLATDVGGGFGSRVDPYPEYVVALAAARQLQRPVRWRGTRSEGFVSDNHGRDSYVSGEMALDKDGRILGLRTIMDGAVGGYFSMTGLAPLTHNFPDCMSTVYAIPLIDVHMRGIFVNTQPLAPYRGAGRPEACYILERLMDQAARETGRDPVEMRRINLIRPGQMPYETPVHHTYDSGDFPAILDKALQAADWDGFETRRKASLAHGRLRGRGIGLYLENAGAVLQESARVGFGEDGMVNVFIAGQSNGQGHITVFTNLVAERFGVPLDKVRLVNGDSDVAPPGMPSVAARTAMMVGSAISVTCDAIINKGRLLAAQALEAGTGDIEFSRGAFRVAGTDRQIGIIELAGQVRAGALTGENLPETLDTQEQFNGTEQSFPNGAHICEVEVDPDTGVTTIARYTTVDDFGVVLNHDIVEGQVHGGIAQGLGQVLGEEARYGESGEMLTGSFMDYYMPRASDLPAFSTQMHNIPCTTNPVGVKGAGEAGTTGALGAAMNAIIDALQTRGISHLEMPATPQRVWAALNGAR